MNILLVSVMRPDAPSGVRVHYLALAAELRQRGHRVDVVTPATLTGPRRHAIAALRHLLLRLGAAPKRLSTNVADFVHILWSIDRRCRYDVVNAQDVSSGVAAQRALGRGVPVVVTGHFNEHPAAEELRQRPATKLVAQAVWRWYDFLLARTQYFMSVSAFGLNLIRPALPARATCRVVLNGIDFAGLRTSTASAGLRAQFPGRHIILNIGQLEGRKNQLLLVEAARELRCQRTDFVVGLVGKGEDEALLRQRIADYGLQDCVVLLGYHAQVLPLLRAADLYVHVATHETFGLVLLEAAAARVPALALAVGGVPEVLAATPEALLLPTLDAASLAQQLHSWLSTPTQRQALASRQAASAEARFDMGRLVDETLAFYRYARRHLHHQQRLLAPPLGRERGVAAATTG